jgi:hypothetical protein
LCGEALAFLPLSGKHLLLVSDLILCSLPLLLHTHTHTHTRFERTFLTNECTRVAVVA